ncbi:MAG: glycosyltransferase [Deltaproteobacteria bacterium]|nr:glycosyltransferase [Deltaproteobacteria bacterium]
MPSPEPHNQPPAGARPLISLVILARDEEANLPRALASARPWVDEIVLLDTGSVDRTVAIAREFGARVHLQPWQNDFSLHRNHALTLARGEWCLQLDADEELDPATAPGLRPLTARPEINGWALEIVNLLPQGQATSFWWPRFFRRVAGVRYFRKVHNDIVIPGGKAAAPVRILHHGYALEPAAMARKRERRLGMLRQACADDPADWLSRAYLADALCEREEDLPAAAAAAREALALARGRGEPPAQLSRAYNPLFTALARQGRVAETLAAGRECLGVFEYPDPWFYAAWAHHMQEEWGETAQAAARFLAAQDRYAADPAAFQGAETRTLGRRGDATLLAAVAEAALGREDRLRDWWARLGPTERPRLLAELTRLGRGEWAARLSGSAWPREAAAPVNPPAPAPVPPPPAGPAAQAAETSPPPAARDTRAVRLAAEAATAAGQGDLARARELYGRALDLAPRAEWWCELAWLLAGAGQATPAREAYQRALALEPEMPGALYNLAVLAAQAGDRAGAAALVRRALAREPGFAAAARLLAGLGG